MAVGSGVTTRGIHYLVPSDAPDLAGITQQSANDINGLFNKQPYLLGVELGVSDSYGDSGVRDIPGTWTKNEDNGAFFVGATTNNTRPITIPAGLGGRYHVGFVINTSVTANATSFVQIGGAPVSIRTVVAAGTGAGANGASGFEASAIVRLADGAQPYLTVNIYSGAVKSMVGTFYCWRLSD